MAQRAVAKVRAHTKGGAGNAIYIGSLREEPTRDAERHPDRRISHPLERDEQLAEMAEGTAGRVVGDDPIWGWNVPWFVAADGYGIWETEEGRALLESRSLALPAHYMGLGPAPQSAEKLLIEEKRENLVAHFSALADLEERLGGLSHFRIILTVGPEVSIHELKVMVNTFLHDNFTLCPAFVAVHDDTEHRHAHVYVHARQLDNRHVDLGQDYFRLDESWMRVCAERLSTPEIYTRHMELKEETRGWKVRAEKAKEARKPLPPKPDRWGDHHDTLLIFRPFDDRWCGRLQAQTRVAETKATWLEATKAEPEKIAAAHEEAQGLRERLETAVKRRSNSKRKSKRRMPAEIITVSEQRELKTYERDILTVERRKAKGIPEPANPRRTVAQAVVPFDEAVAALGGQLSFDFGRPTERQGRETAAAQAGPEHIGQKPHTRKQASKQAPFAGTASRAEEMKDKQRTATIGEQKDHVPNVPQREDITGEGAEVRATATVERLPEPAIHTWPDDEVRRMIADFELTNARALALRAAEEDFNAAPHRYESPTHRVTLAEVEAQISDALKRGQDVRRLNDLKGCIQDQVVVERVNAPLGRKEAEEEARALRERLTAEAAARGHLGLKMPDAVMNSDELREMVKCAEVSRNPKLLRTAYEIELEQALRAMHLTDDVRHVLHLEERYLGVELKAEVRVEKARQFVTEEVKHPEKTLLPASDEEGRDITLTLEQAGQRRGIRGVISTIVETAARRHFREQLAETREAYFRHLHSDVERRETFHGAVRAITQECRQRCREFGYRAPAWPELAREEIQEIRDYAVQQTGAKRERWLSTCTNAQRLADERDAAAWQPAKTVEVFSPGLTPQQRSDLIRQEIETKHAAVDAYQRTRIAVIERDRQDTHTPLERGSPEQDRPRGGRSRSR